MVHVKATNFQLVEDEEAGLDLAIEEAAGFNNPSAKQLSVERIQVLDTVSSVYETEHESQGSSEKCGRLPEGLPNKKSTVVSALLVSERKFSGTESVQINEKLINRES